LLRESLEEILSTVGVSLKRSFWESKRDTLDEYSREIPGDSLEGFLGDSLEGFMRDSLEESLRGLGGFF